MAFNLQIFRTRALTAIVFVMVMMVGLLWSKWTFLILFSVIHLGCWFEYQKMVGLIDIKYRNISSLQRYGVMIAGWGLMLSMIDKNVSGGSAVHNFGVIISLIGFALLLSDIIKNFTSKNGSAVLYSLLGLLYISLPWTCMIAIRNANAIFKEPASVADMPFIIPIILIASIWINDTMAYIVGSFIGKTPFSKISPKKTWEGTVGGAILCVVTVTLAGYYLLKFRDITSLIFISAIAAVVGTTGDLLESKLKRMANVKDSGHLMPGHGGFLDRFDSLLLATPFVCLYVFLFMIRFYLD
ncbi:MAG: phosphatidate cytidylyltransferase [Segetibacter sp.]|nr:phosphatidate cytidylyltransferase [Segetibacter sp.]